VLAFKRSDLRMRQTTVRLFQRRCCSWWTVGFV